MLLSSTSLLLHREIENRSMTPSKVGLLSLPEPLMLDIMGRLDRTTVLALAMTDRAFRHLSGATFPFQRAEPAGTLTNRGLCATRCH